MASPKRECDATDSLRDCFGCTITRMAKRKQNILVIDAGGTNLKIIDSNHSEPIKIPSGIGMTAERMVTEVKNATEGWNYAVVSIGYPGAVVQGKPLTEPHNLGPGWVSKDFDKA